MPVETDTDLNLTTIEAPPIRIVYKVNWLIQFWALLTRSMLAVFREPMVTRIRITQNIVIIEFEAIKANYLVEQFTAVLLGLIYWRLDMDQLAIMNINGALFLLIIALNFQCAFGVINVSMVIILIDHLLTCLFFQKTFCLEIPLFLREHNNGLYRVSSYFVAKMFAEVIFL